jgi:hypothetical protein
VLFIGLSLSVQRSIEGGSHGTKELEFLAGLASSTTNTVFYDMQNECERRLGALGRNEWWATFPDSQDFQEIIQKSVSDFLRGSMDYYDINTLTHFSQSVVTI